MIITKNLPAPTPSVKPQYRNSSTRSTPRLATLSSYSQVDNGCLHEDTLIHLSNNTSLACKTLGKGTVVTVYNPVTGIFSTDKIECVVKTKCGTGRFASIKKSGYTLNITGWHPIFIDGKWKFPANLAPMYHLPSEYVYSFVLQNRSAAMICNGYPCITLATCLTDNVAAHKFWGTEKIENL